MSDSEHWLRLSELFDELVVAPLEERERSLQALAASEPSLADELRRMLEADAAADSRIEEGVAAFIGPTLARALDPEPEDATGATEGALSIGTTVGPWRLLRLLGRGGMGEVWEAERAEGDFEQVVALKLLRRGVDTEDVLARFLRERRLLAQLQHPNIARLLDGGSTADGRPWFAMERVEGRPITEHCDAHGLDLEARLRLFLEVCEAVGYAHRSLVIHRDLKPSNILVNDQSEVRLLDFGIAKLMEGDEGAETQVTRAGTRLLTPAYAAPEQINGTELTVGTDVYSLGVVLYELLSGQLPHPGRPADGERLAEALDRETIEHPSMRVLRGSQGPTHVGGLDTGGLARRLAGDLDTILLVALAKEPERRYPTVAALAADLRRYLDGQPIKARPSSVGYRAGKFVRRHRIGVAAAFLVASSLVLGMGVALWQTRLARTAQLHAEAHAVRAEEAARKARAQSERTDRVRQFVVEMFMQNDPLTRGTSEPKPPEELLGEAVERIDREFAADPEMQAELLDEIAQIHVNAGRLTVGEPLALRALELRRRTLGPRALGTAESLVTLAGVELRRGQLDRADELLAEAEEVFEENEGRESWDVANVLGGRAQILVARRQENAALELLEESFHIARKVRGEADIEVNMRLHNLAVGLSSVGRFEEALTASQEAMASLEPLLGPSHPRLAFLLLNQGTSLTGLGRDAEARERLRRAFAIAFETFGEEHLLVGRALLELAMVDLRLGELAEAEKALIRARPIAAATLAMDEPRVVRALAELRLQQQRPAEAAAFFTEAEVLSGRLLGEDHPQRWEAALDAAVARARAGDPHGALKPGETAAKRLAGLHGEDSEAAVAAWQRLESIRASLGMPVAGLQTGDGAGPEGATLDPAPPR